MDQERHTTRLADGTILQESVSGYADRNLWISIKDKTMAECFALFSDPEKTSEISVKYVFDGVIYRGFTDLLLIRKNESTVDVRLSWPEGGEHSIEKFDERVSDDADGTVETDINTDDTSGQLD